MSLLERETFDGIEPAGAVGQGESFWVLVKFDEGVKPVARVGAGLRKFVQIDNELVQIRIALNAAAKFVGELEEGGVGGGIFLLEKFFNNVLLENAKFVFIGFAEFRVEADFGEVALEHGKAEGVESHDRGAAEKNLLAFEAFRFDGAGNFAGDGFMNAGAHFGGGGVGEGDD